jgi:hypothetical protein
MKTTRYLLLILLALFTTISTTSAQQNTFQLDFYLSTQDDIRGVIQNAAGDYVLAGSTFNVVSNYDPVISIVSPTGVVLQTKTYTSLSSDFIYSICQTSDGGYFLTGATYISSNNYDCLVIKLDAALNTVFYKSYGTAGNDYGNRGFEISPGHYTVTGTIALGGSAKPSVVTLNDLGNVVGEGYLVTNQFASPNYKGSYVATNEIALSNLTNAITIVDTNGIIVKHYPNSFGTYSRDIIKASNGEYVCINFAISGIPGAGPLTVARVDSTLTTFTGGNSFKVLGRDLIPVKIIQDAANNFLIAANGYDYNSGNSIPLLIKTDSACNLLWCHNFIPAGSVNAFFNSFESTSDGGFILGGNNGAWNNQHFFFVKLDSSGSSVCNSSLFSLQTQGVSTQSQTTHGQYSGAVSSITTSSQSFGAVSPTINLLCLSTSVQELESTNDISINPTFVKDNFVVSSEVYNAIEIFVYDGKGALLLQQQVDSGSTISMANYSTGIYIVKCTTTDGKYYSTRLFKAD